LNHLLKKGLNATQVLFASVCPLYKSVYQVAHVLGNQEKQEADALQRDFADQLALMRGLADQEDHLRPALLYFLKVTQSYAPHLFFCYQVADLPRTNNDLEQADRAKCALPSAEQPVVVGPSLDWSCEVPFG
jgi:hypothetical protein